MRKLKFALIALVTISLTSCRRGLKSENMADQKAIDKIMEKVGQVITEDNVKKVGIYAEDDLNKGYGKVRVTYKRDKEYYTIVYGTKMADPRKEYGSNPDEKDDAKSPAKKVVDFKFDNVVATYNKAVEEIKTEVKELEDFYLYSIERKLKADGSFKTIIKINATKKGEGSHQEGRSIVTNYYQAIVTINKDGTLKIKY